MNETLESLLQAQIERVDERVFGGGTEQYRSECGEVRAAADTVRALVLARDPVHVRSLAPAANKPQFLLILTRYGRDDEASDEVLKVYGRRRPGERATHGLWRGAGLPGINVLDGSDDPVSWLTMQWLDLLDVGHSPGATVTADLAYDLVARWRAGAAALAGQSDDDRDRHGWRPLANALPRHLAAVCGALSRHGYTDADTVDSTVEQAANAYADGEMTVLHGDLAPANVAHLASGELILLDPCGYVGPPEFDAARWSARVGGVDAEAVLELWLAYDPGLSRQRARRLLGWEVLMEAGVRELVKDENGTDIDYPDAGTLRLLEVSHRVLSSGS